MVGVDQKARSSSTKSAMMIKDIGVQRFLHDIRYRRDRYRQFIGIAFVVLVTVAGHPTDGLFWIGAVVACSGTAVRLWASGHIKKNKVLANDGPYQYVRHPLYVGNILLGCGFVFVFYQLNGVERTVIHFDSSPFLSPSHTT